MTRRRSGGSRGCTDTPEWHAWQSMIARCLSPTHKAYANYGGRGISVFNAWVVDGGFVNFLASVGPRPSPNHSLDRIDNAGNYEPGNVRWSTINEQNRNKRSNRRITAYGTTMLMKDWSRATGETPDKILGRIKRGWSPERAVMRHISNSDLDLFDGSNPIPAGRIVRKHVSLTENDVREIRALKDSGMKQTVIAEKFGASDQLISLIVRGKQWKHVQ